MALRLIQGEPCPRRRAEARVQRRARAAALDPHDVRFWLRERSAGAVGDPSSEGARSLLARAEAEHIEEEARKAARVAREGKEERLVQCRWQVKAKRVKVQRQATWVALLQSGLDPEEIKQGKPLVTLRRVAKGLLDSDNLAGSLKAVRDQVAAWLAVDDGPSGPVTWAYDQRKTKAPLQSVEIELGQVRP